VNTRRTSEKAVIYVRVESRNERKQLVGAARQLWACLRRAKERKADIVAGYIDLGAGGGSIQQDGLRAMLERLARHDINYVVVAALDRLSRSYANYVELRAAIECEATLVVAFDADEPPSKPKKRFRAPGKRGGR